MLTDQFWRLANQNELVERGVRDRFVSALRSVSSQASRVASRLMNRLKPPSISNKLPTMFRWNGRGADSFFLNVPSLNRALQDPEESDGAWLKRNAISARALLVLWMYSFQSHYTVDVAEIDVAIEVGRMALRLSHRTHLNVPFGFWFLTYGNPQYLKSMSPSVMISETHCLGLQALASAKGCESKHAHTKKSKQNDTNGHADWPVQLVVLQTTMALARTDPEFSVADLNFTSQGLERWSSERKEGACRCGVVLSDADRTAVVAGTADAAFVALTTFLNFLFLLYLYPLNI